MPRNVQRTRRWATTWADLHEEPSGLQTTIMPEGFAHSSSTESTNSVQPFLQRQDGSASGWRYERERDAWQVPRNVQRTRRWATTFAKFKVRHSEFEIGAQKSLLPIDEKILKRELKVNQENLLIPGTFCSLRKCCLAARWNIREVKTEWLEWCLEKMYNDEIQHWWSTTKLNTLHT